VLYEGPARALVGALKFRAARGLADEMAAAVAAGAPAGLLEGALVPVPLAPRRRRGRGYNQAEALARALSRRTGMPVCRALERSGGPGRQLGRGRRARLARAPGFRARRTVPARAVLVDDVITTGATLAACGRALRAAGVREVAAVAYARTPGR
jgi:ComF family protein